MSATHDPIAAAAPCLELAVYTVHAAHVDAFPAVQAAVHAAIRTLPGFHSSERLRGLDDPTLFADYIRWESRAAAEDAAARLPALAVAAPFLAAIAAMRTFTHLPVSDPGAAPT